MTWPPLPHIVSIVPNPREWYDDGVVVTFVEPVTLHTRLGELVSVEEIGVHWEADLDGLNFCLIMEEDWIPMSNACARWLYQELAERLHQAGVPGGKP